MATTTQLSLYKQAKNLVSLTIYAGNPNATGLITWGTGIDISVAGTGTFDSLSLTVSRNKVSLRPADSTIENMANEWDTFTGQIVEMAPIGTIGTIASLCAGFSHCKIIAKLAPVGSTTYTAIAVIGSWETYDTGLTQGKNTNAFTISPAGYAVYEGLFSALPAAF